MQHLGIRYLGANSRGSHAETSPQACSNSDLQEPLSYYSVLNRFLCSGAMRQRRSPKLSIRVDLGPALGGWGVSLEPSPGNTGFKSVTCLGYSVPRFRKGFECTKCLEISSTSFFFHSTLGLIQTLPLTRSLPYTILPSVHEHGPAPFYQQPQTVQSEDFRH